MQCEHTLRSCVLEQSPPTSAGAVLARNFTRLRSPQPTAEAGQGPVYVARCLHNLSIRLVISSGCLLHKYELTYKHPTERKTQMYRHGDLLIVSAPIPQDAVVTPTDILAYGEATGHHHKLVPFSLDEKYLVSEARPSGGYDAEFISGEELLKRQPVDYIGGKK